MLANVTEFILTTLSLGASGAVFAVVLYYLFQGKLGKMKALDVTDDRKTLAGLPFYLKRGRLTQETSYLETLALCTLTAKKTLLDDKDEPVQTETEYAGTKTVSQSASSEKALAALRLALAVAQQAESANQEKLWLVAREKFEQLPAYDGQLPNYPLPLAGNVIKESAFVDYENMLYINQHQPLIGSSEINLELAADGTLSKASAKATDSTFEKLLGYLPTDILATKKTAQPSSDARPAQVLQDKPTQKFGYEFALTIKQQYVRHTCLREIKPFSDRSLKAPLPLGDQNSWYQREILTDLDPEPEKPVAPAADKDKKDEEK